MTLWEILAVTAGVFTGRALAALVRALWARRARYRRDRIVTSHAYVRDVSRDAGVVLDLNGQTERLRVGDGLRLYVDGETIGVVRVVRIDNPA